MARLFERLQNLENEKNLDFVRVDAGKAKKSVTVKRAAAAQRKPVKRTRAR